MKKKIFIVTSFILIFVSKIVYCQTLSYKVKSGDSMWKIAVKYEVGVSEIIAANPKIKNPSMIYVGQTINVPNISDIKALENEVIRLVNIERSKKGLMALKTNWQISRIARYKSQDMINKNYFDHYSPTYGSPFNMMESFSVKFSAAGENIAMGQRTPSEVMNGWMNSPGHRANILSAAYSEIGVGVAKNKNGMYYWTQMFIKPN